MAQTMTDEKSSNRYPTAWVLAIVAAAALAAAGYSLPGKAPSASAPAHYEALDENFAP